LAFQTFYFAKAIGRLSIFRIPSDTRHIVKPPELRRGVPGGFRFRSLRSEPRRPRSIGAFSAKIEKANQPHHNRGTKLPCNVPGKVRRLKQHQCLTPSGVFRLGSGRESPVPDPTVENSRTCYSELQTRKLLCSPSQLVIEKFAFRLSGLVFAVIIADDLFVEKSELFFREFLKGKIVPLL